MTLLYSYSLQILMNVLYTMEVVMSPVKTQKGDTFAPVIHQGMYWMTILKHV